MIKFYELLKNSNCNGGIKMDFKRYLEYVKYISQLLNEKNIEILWRQNNGGLNVKIDLETELPKVNPSFIEEEFIEVTFEVIAISRLIAIDNVLDEKNGYKDIKNVSKNTDISLIDKIQIIKENFLNDKLIQYINVQTQSITNVLEDINFDILTKRSRKNPSKVITYSALLSLYIRDGHTNVDNEVADKITVELTEQDILNTIDLLNDTLSSMEKIKKISLNK